MDDQIRRNGAAQRGDGLPIAHIASKGTLATGQRDGGDPPAAIAEPPGERLAQVTVADEEKMHGGFFNDQTQAETMITGGPASEISCIK